jgi:hypothetical protein
VASPEAERPLQFACRATSFKETRALVRQVDEARWASEVHRTTHPRASSIDFAHRLVDAFDRSRESSSQS